jgi:molybdenum cofactor cytidylyltransferase
VPEVAAIVLAAGRASRFGAGPGESKVLAEWAGLPLVRHVAMRALAARASPVVVVTGNAAAGVSAALAGLSVTLVANEDWARGMAGSLETGIAALPAATRGTLVMLGDMPLVCVETLDRLIAAFLDAVEPDAVVPVHGERSGNPVLLGRRLFGAIATLRGDEGARKLLAEPGRTILRCAVDDPGILVDVDTREALAALGASAPKLR